MSSKHDVHVVFPRRDFLKVAAGAAAATGFVPGVAGGGFLLAQERRPGQQGQEGPPPVPLGNGEPPAFTFQAYPGGTGSLLEKMWREDGGSPFTREPMVIEPWSGSIPDAEEEIAFLPVHRLAALIRERHISPTELTEIYLERLKRYDPVLLCAVTILEGRGREEAQEAEAEIRRGEWKGPLHGIPWGVKDLFTVAGAPTTWGAEPFRNQVIEEDAEVVRRLREVPGKDQEPLERGAGVQRLVGRPSLGHGSRLCRLRNRKRNPGLHHLTGASLWPERPSPHVREGFPAWGNGAGVEHGQGGSPLPVHRGLRPGL
jgi:hypothetical protein